MLTKQTLTIAVALLSAAHVACESGSPTATPAPAASGSVHTYHKSAAPVFAARCTQCHTKGGPAPFVLDDYASAKQWATASLASIAAKRMPPWQPSGDCRHYDGERSISADEVKALQDWVAAKMPEGDPKDYKAPASVANLLPKVPDRTADLSLQSAEAYTADVKQSDDYRCFVVGPEFKEETWVHASRVTPGDKPSVHHVILYLVGPSAAWRAPEKDAQTPGPGWTCFGGPGLSPAQNVGGWVPGSVPTVYPADAGIRIAPGSRLVLQVHYNTLGHKPAPDQTLAEVWLHKDKPANLMAIRPLPDFGIQIAAGDAKSVHTKEFENGGTKPWTIVGVMAHMHQLGSQISVVKKASPDVCLIDIPRWDFNWQQGYRFKAGEQVVVQPGEKLLLQCTYDNSAANQMSVGGVQKAPVNVTWGEGTADEMCLAYITTVEPYTELPKSSGTDSLCNGAQGCYDNCRKGGTSQVLCSFQCSSKGGGKCTGCMMQGIIGCAAQNGCPGQSQTVIDCITACGKDPAGLQACATKNCLSSIVAFDGCASPLLNAGGICHAEGSGCGVKL